MSRSCSQVPRSCCQWPSHASLPNSDINTPAQCTCGKIEVLCYTRSRFPLRYLNLPTMNGAPGPQPVRLRLKKSSGRVSGSCNVILHGNAVSTTCHVDAVAEHADEVAVSASQIRRSALLSQLLESGSCWLPMSKAVFKLWLGFPGDLECSLQELCDVLEVCIRLLQLQLSVSGCRCVEPHSLRFHRIPLENSIESCRLHACPSLAPHWLAAMAGFFILPQTSLQVPELDLHRLISGNTTACFEVECLRIDCLK